MLHYFTKARILQLPKLVQYMTLCYVKSGLAGPVHIHNLWKKLTWECGQGCYSDKTLTYEPTSRQWLHNLAQIAQVKLWNARKTGGLEPFIPLLSFKQMVKNNFLNQCCDTPTLQGYDIDALLQSRPLDNFPYNSS